MVILIFSAAYVLSWLFFTCVWLFAAFVDTNGPNNSTCLVSVTDFNSAFLLSLSRRRLPLDTGMSTWHLAALSVASY